MQQPCHSTGLDKAQIARRIFTRYGGLVDEWDAFMETLLRPQPVALWANPLRLTRTELIPLLAQEGMQAEAMAWNDHGLRLGASSRPGLHWGFQTGLFRIQEEVSMLPVHLLDPRPGERVLDLCAAPGNKTAQVAVAMNNQGTVISNDLNRGRIAGIRQSVKRLGLINVAVTVTDGQRMDARAGAFDRVLLDAPCSGEGMFRKLRVPRPVDAVARERLVRLQCNLLRRAIHLARPGGRIVYSTCTLAPEENEAVVDGILREFDGALRLLPAQIPRFAVSSGVIEWQGRAFRSDVAKCLRVWPHQNNTGGFFVAVLEKHSGAALPEPVPCLQLPEAGPEWRVPFTERLGIPPAAFEHYRLVERGNRHVCFVPREPAFPQWPLPDLLGLPALRRRSLPLKPTTSAILLLGHHATRNFVDLDEGQARSYLQREDAILKPDQLSSCTGPGYAIARYHGQVLGLGQLVYHRGDPGVHMMSLLPKGIADLCPQGQCKG